MYKENKGYQYEEIAKRYLLKNNYKIIEENFMSKFGEIDVIASKDEEILFIEVKGRKNSNFGMPREAVTLNKQKKIIATAKYFLLKNKYYDVQCRFDVIEILLDDKSIQHIENAFWL
nr:YraN family protein [Sedimentibacter sp.]